MKYLFEEEPIEENAYLEEILLRKVQNEVMLFKEFFQVQTKRACWNKRKERRKSRGEINATYHKKAAETDELERIEGHEGLGVHASRR